MVNPGSVGLPAYHNPMPEPYVVETGSPAARYPVLEAYEHGLASSAYCPSLLGRRLVYWIYVQRIINLMQHYATIHCCKRM